MAVPKSKTNGITRIGRRFTHIVLRILFAPVWIPWRLATLPFRLRRTSRERFILVSIFIATLLAGALIWSSPWNKGASFLNARFDNRIKALAEKSGSEKARRIAQKLADAVNIPSIQAPFLLGLDLQGGTQLIYEADVSDTPQEDVNATMQGLRDILERRVNSLGVREPVVQLEETPGHHRILIELAGIRDIKEAVAAVGETPSLEFREERSEEELEVILSGAGGGEITPEIREQLRQVPEFRYTTADPPLTGRYLKRATVQFDQTTGQAMVGLEFNSEGAEIFKTLTAKNVGKSLAIFINKDLISAPTVQQEITGGNAVISGTFTVEEARYLARNLNAGALDAPITLMSQETVGPTLGQESLGGIVLEISSLGVRVSAGSVENMGHLGPIALGVEGVIGAGALGFTLVTMLMLVLYRLAGLVAVCALGIYAVLVLAMFKLFSVTLTLPGIAGFILSIGMAVDANILIFSRMREERRWGRPFGSSITEGFVRAWSSIRDSNISTLITTAILFFVGTSFIKGFALTLGIGVLISMFTAVFVSRLLLKQFIGTKLERFGWLW